jgi:Tol biopolymer transport system component
VSSYITDRDLVLVDRQGHETRALPTGDRYDHPRLSPDGGRVALDVRSATAAGDIWVFQVGRPGGIRITSESGRDFGSEWTPDGEELIYSSERPYFDLYRRSADASSPPVPLVTGGFDHYAGGMSADGRLFAYTLSTPNGTQLWTVPLQGRQPPLRYLSNGFNLAHPVLSPDGRWMAYDSDESGRVEVYVQSYPDPIQKRWKVSPSYGSEPLWTRGGRELVYRSGDSVLAVSMDLQRGQSGPPTLLFAGPYPDNPGFTRPRSYDASRDGERFLMTKLPTGLPEPRVMVVENWFSELRAKVPR